MVTTGELKAALMRIIDEEMYQFVITYTGDQPLTELTNFLQENLRTIHGIDTTRQEILEVLEEAISTLNKRQMKITIIKEP